MVAISVEQNYPSVKWLGHLRLVAATQLLLSKRAH